MNPIRPLLGSLAFVALSAAGAEANPTLLSASFGPIQVSYPYDYRLFPSEPFDMRVVQDGDISTGLFLQGLDGILQDNGAIVDTAPFALFRYHLDPGDTAIEIRVHGQVDYSLEPAREIFIEVLNIDDGSFRSGLQGHAATAGWFEWAIDTTGNSGSVKYTLDDVVSPDGVITFAVQFGWGAQLNQPGRVEGYLNEIEVDSCAERICPPVHEVPEPEGLAQLGMGIGLYFCGLAVRRKRRLSPTM